MLSVNNNSNYSPNFGKLYIAKNSVTKAALQKCSQETLDSITKAENILYNTKFLQGIIKKVDNGLSFRVGVPKGFEFPNGLAYKEELQFVKGKTNTNGHYVRRNFNFVNYKNNKDIVTIQGKDFLKLKKAGSRKNIVEYEIVDSNIYKDTKGNHINDLSPLNIVTLAKKLLACDYDLNELASGRIKLKN